MDIEIGRKRIEIFCCYAHQDLALLDELKNHLQLWERLDLITVWTDRDISPGTNWQQEINQHLNTAQIILLLISSDFIASDYCWSVEMRRAIERSELGETRMLPILLRNCTWEEAPFRSLQVLPTRARPVLDSSWHNRDDAYTDVARGIRHVVKELQKQENRQHNTGIHQVHQLLPFKRRNTLPLPPLPINRVQPSTLLKGSKQNSPKRKHGFSKSQVILLTLILMGSGYLFISAAINNHHMQVLQNNAANRALFWRPAFDTYNAAITKDGAMFGFDAQHTNTNPYEQILNIANVSTIEQIWKASVGITYSSPVVANGLVYANSDDGKLYALDPITGQQKWTASVGKGNLNSPAFANGLIYTDSAKVVEQGSILNRSDYKFCAFNATTGQLQWASPIAGDTDSSPTIAHGIVYVSVNADNNFSLYAFDAATGQKKWSSPTGGYIGSSPAEANGIVYIGSGDYKLYAFNAITGQQKWVSSTAAMTSSFGGQRSSPSIANGVVYIGSDDGRLYAFDARTGQQKWASPTGELIDSSPAEANGMVYVGSWDRKLYAFDAQSGQQKWIAGTNGVIRSSPAIANGFVVVGSDDSSLYIFNAKTGQQKWTASTGGGISSNPAIANGFIYIDSSDGNLYAFSLP